MDIPPLLSGERFAASLFRAATPGNGNFLLSPRSVAETLGLLSLGACGETFDAILDALSFDDYREWIRTFVHAEEAIREAGGPGAQCETDTALWIRKGLALRPGFRKRARWYFGAEIAEIPMDETGRNAINGHVSQATRGMIPELLPTPPEGDLVATNAVWFKGKWDWPFDPDYTRPGTFHAPEGKIRVPFMHRTEWLPYFEGDGYEAVRLPYRDWHFAFDVFLPRPGVPVAGIECRFEEVLARTRAAFAADDATFLALALPKFDLDCSLDLKMALFRLGAGRIFSPERADFSDIVDGAGAFCVSGIIHQARLRLDEEGTEAAAATAPLMVMGIPPPPRPFRVDRPFLFALRLCETGDILFCGRAARPAP